MPKELEKFFIALTLRDGQVVGHETSSTPKSFDPADKPEEGEQSEAKAESTQTRTNEFETVFNDFVSTIESYRRFISLVLDSMPFVARHLARNEIAKFARSKGVRRPDLEAAAVEAYELDLRFLHDYLERHSRLMATIEGARLLPEIMIVGLVSAYDSFLAALLRVTIDKHEELVLTSQKQITFRELMAFDSIEDARAHIIEREIETALRKSHHEQFDWM